MKLYKLTDGKGQTKNNTQWGENITHTATGDISQDLCTDAWIHAYESLEIALLMNPIHCNYSSDDMQIWLAEGEIRKKENQTKYGCRSLMTIRQLTKEEIPAVTTEIRVRFAIFCALEVYKEDTFVKWAQDWLDNKNCTAAAARVAAAAARVAAAAARVAAADADAAADAANIDLISLSLKAFQG